MADIGRSAMDAVFDFRDRVLAVQSFSAATGESLAESSRRLEPRHTFDHRDVILAVEFTEAWDELREAIDGL